MKAWPIAVLLVACGHGSGSRPDATGGDGTASDGGEDLDGHASDAAIDASIDAAPDARPGQGITASGTCTYIDRPGWLSCPTGMSCQCYYHYWKLFENQPAHLDTWLSGTTLDVLGGSIPDNSTVYGVTPVTIPLSGTPLTGTVFPFQVTVGPTGAVTITIYATSGYIPPNFVKYTDSDCGSEGKLLQCTFAN